MSFVDLSLRCVLVPHGEYQIVSSQSGAFPRLWFFPPRPHSFLYSYQLSHRFNVMLVLTLFGQSQSSVMTIGCEWISWIHGVQWPKSKQTGGRGPSLSCSRSADAPQRWRYPCHCVDWEWYVVGTWRKMSARGRPTWRRSSPIQQPGGERCSEWQTDNQLPFLVKNGMKCSKMHVFPKSE